MIIPEVDEVVRVSRMRNNSFDPAPYALYGPHHVKVCLIEQDSPSAHGWDFAGFALDLGEPLTEWHVPAHETAFWYKFEDIEDEPLPTDEEVNAAVTGLRELERELT